MHGQHGAKADQHVTSHKCAVLLDALEIKTQALESCCLPTRTDLTLRFKAKPEGFRVLARTIVQKNLTYKAMYSTCAQLPYTALQKCCNFMKAVTAICTM